ncbi:MAG: hypothetical protein QOD99_935 [Chthoniobacter sp.]|nr:hypothetical protein [Chthoniobacter sp.]
MEVTPPIPRQHVGRTFVVAISLLGFVALAQIGAVAWAFISRFHAATPGDLALPVKSAVPEKLTLVDPFATMETPAPQHRATPLPEVGDQQVASLPKPTPVPLQKPTTESRLTELVEQARALRDKGDTSTALTRLHEAQAISPDSALIISELATTFEKMGQTDKALEQWRRIFDMGESAGIYYQAADAKLKASEAAAQPVAKREAADISGIQPGSVLGLGAIAVTEQTDPNASKKFVLKIPLKARPNANIEVKDVTIQVFFYDIIDATSIVQTSANVSSRWSTLPADWKDDDVEVLEVEYSQPLPAAKLAKVSENRAYFGYVVRVYYRGELQDWRADQDKLRAKYPPPLTLSTDQAQ